MKITLGAIVLLVVLSCSSDPVSPDIPQDITEVPRVTVEQLQARLDAGEAIAIVDVRLAAAYDQEHIPGALNIPSSEVTSRLDEFPQDRDIILYCT